MNEEQDVHYFEGDRIMLHGTANRPVKKLVVVKDLGSPHMVLCQDACGGIHTQNTYARHSLRLIKREIK